MKKFFLAVFFILFLLSPAKAKAEEFCSALPSDRVVGNSFELVCTGLDSEKKYRLLLDDSEECHSTTISESQLSPDNNGRLNKSITSWVIRSETIHIKLYEQVFKNTCDLWNDQPIFSLESRGVAPAPTFPMPSPPCSAWDGNRCTKVATGLGIDISTDPTEFVKSIFGIILGLAGGIALLLIIFSGYKLMTSQGNPEKVQGAKETLTSAIVGLLFIIFSLVILQIIGVEILKIPGFQ